VSAVLTPTRRLTPTLAFSLVGGIIGLALFASATPTPLYADYAALWHFSTPVLTAVYAVYAIGVLASLLLVGRLSDEIGRRPVLIASLVGLLGSTVLFMSASSVAWLFAARGLQGLATGAVLGAAGAALLDLVPDGDAGHAGLVNGVASAAGLAAGGLLSAVLVQEAPDPRVTPYVVLFALFALTLAATPALPEPVERAERPRLRPQKPQVPPAIRSAFTLAGAGVVASWSIGGLYFALAPTLVDKLLDTHNHLAGGATVFVLAGSGALGQLVFNRLSPQRAMGGGALALAVGMAASAASVSLGSAGLFLASSALTGVGFGVAFMGALRTISTVAPTDRRAAVMSAFYIVCYLSLSLPAVAAGLAAPSLGIEATFRVFSAAVVLVALLVAAGTRNETLFAPAASA
jgi:MFS family permease